ncbi:MAG: DNA polymerase III subunit delta' [Burkholderiales bacterium]|jgi:DNA polymerase-3 subunit delta'|uniref:DNA polymerase III subunit delta n=1 Tax=Candidatus Desulfobacillus denitrificans TaxID=2608985 RepID=A0A809S4Z3_9PROT|nr:hypothetical protein [Rhodocyclaceae bacterium]MCZ2174392.1 DNA polymerase III subunit delta' [Burkholderiales bacterium]BBO20861.1 DNA polymerase III subunit delta' [Candidatus Desulfobacillus denitrificans]MCL4723508.1 DNA polymerase III subunit delta' [Rhodocyclaceae bacterium]MCQ3925249.1 DNA polymerase III subunit delta' [Rhodocyclaceae bacterium]
MIYVWQKELWNKLLGQVERLPHALLLSGPAGGGKKNFAHDLAARLLCEKASGINEACRACASCNWFFSGNHPDFRLIEPGGDEPEDSDSDAESASMTKKKSDQIRINQIRNLDSFLGIGTHRQGLRIIVIQPAETMNQATANALLKILEEPSTNTLFILITNNKKRLLPTILSRCQTVNFPKPASKDALAWLKDSGIQHAEDLLSHAGGLPLAAADESKNRERLDTFFHDLAQVGQVGPVAIAGRWEGWLKENKDGEPLLEKRTLVTWLQKWVFDLITVKMTGSVVFHSHKQREIHMIAGGASLHALIDCYNELLRIKAVSQHPLNPRLFFEDMLTRYGRAAVKGS